MYTLLGYALMRCVLEPGERARGRWSRVNCLMVVWVDGWMDEKGAEEGTALREVCAVRGYLGYHVCRLGGRFKMKGEVTR